VTGNSAGPDLPDRRSAKVLSQKAFWPSAGNAAAVSAVKVAGPGVMQTADTARLGRISRWFFRRLPTGQARKTSEMFAGWLKLFPSPGGWLMNRLFRWHRQISACKKPL